MIADRFFTWINDKFNKATSFLDQIQTRHYFDCLIISLIVAISFFVFGPSLDSNWGIVDDHEIMVFSPSYNPMGFRDLIPTYLTKTEISPSSTLARFRPVYYFLRLLETRFFGSESPFLWYLARVGLFIIFISVLYLFFKKINGRLIGGLLSLLIATFDFWASILSRLGPSETYAILGLTLFLVGVLILCKKRESNLAWFFLMLGTITAIGSKENMIVFLIPEIFLAFYYIRKPIKRNIFPFVMVAISIVWTVWIISTLFLRIKASGSDVYANSVGLMARFSILLEYISQHIFQIVFIGLLLLGGILGLLVGKSKGLRPQFLKLVFGSTGIFLLIFSQVFFYSGSIWERYNFPYALFLPFTISIAASFIQSLPFLQNKRVNYFSSFAMAAIIIIFFIHPANISKLHAVSKECADATHQFKANLDEIENYFSNNQNSPIVFYGNNPGSDYERIQSYIRYLRSDSYQNDVYIFRDPPSNYESIYPKLEASLEKELVSWSTNGISADGVKPIQGYFTNPSDCIFLSLAKEYPASITCETVINVSDNIQ